MKSAVNMALLIMTIYEYFFPRIDEEEQKKEISNYIPVDIETSKMNNDLLLTEPGIRRFNSMRELPDASYPYKFDESDEEEEQKLNQTIDGFIRQDDQ